MPETTAQKRQRKLHEAVVAARARRESPQESAATEKIVSPSAPAATTGTPGATKEKPVHVDTSGQPNPSKSWGSNWARSLGPKAQAKTYQKHVLFALVTAFLIQLVANGRKLPTK